MYMYVCVCLCVCALLHVTMLTRLDAYHIAKYRKKTQTNYKTYVIPSQRSNLDSNVISCFKCLSSINVTRSDRLLSVCILFCPFALQSIFLNFQNIKSRLIFDFFFFLDASVTIRENKTWQTKGGDSNQHNFPCIQLEIYVLLAHQIQWSNFFSVQIFFILLSWQIFENLTEFDV